MTSVTNVPNEFRVWIPWVNRLDLLQDAVSSLADVHPWLTILDNSPDPAQPLIAQWPDCPCAIYRPPVPLTFTQSQNYFLQETRRLGASVMIWMHSDAECEVGACSQLATLALEKNHSDPAWGVIYTHYDCLSAVNTTVPDDIGGYDTTFAAYFSDNDFYHRMDLAGRKRLESGIKVTHHGSQTVNSDPWLKIHTGLTFGWYREYYRLKHGGLPGEEVFDFPFNIPGLSWKSIF